jgi:hypothetical protein
MSAGEIDGLSLILFDFYVPTLTPRLHRSEAALDLSENIALFVTCTIQTYVIRENRWMNTWALRDIVYI